MIGQPAYAYWPSFFWGLLVLISFVGWGRALIWALSRGTDWESRQFDWALLAGWGMSCAIALGGVLAWMSLASRGVLIAFVLAGSGIWLVGISRRSVPGRFGRSGGVGRCIAGLALILLIGLWYAPAVALPPPPLYSPDDFVAYLPFAKRLLQSGTLVEPFSLRRLATLGGQAILHAMTLCFGTENNGNLLDCGLGAMLTAGLLFGYLRKRGLSMYAGIGISALFLLIPVPRINMMSQATGVVLLFTLFRSLTLCPDALGGYWQRLLVVGVVAAAVCSLRVSLYVAAFLIVAGALLFSEGSRRWNWKAIASPAIALGFAGLSMIPWMLLLYRSSRSFLYPFMQGTQQAGFNAYSAGLGWVQAVAFCGRFLVHPNMLPPVGASLASAVLFPNRLSAVFTAAAIVTGAALALSFTFSDPANLYRYTHPVLFAALMASASRPLGAVWQRSTRGRRLISACLLGLLLPYLLVSWNQGVRGQAAALGSLPLQVFGQQPFASDSELQSYRMLQASIPRRAGLYAVLDKPSLLDYGGTRIYNADIPGACSLPPGMPFFRGPDSVKKYFKSLGIEYIAYTDFETALPHYNRSNWLRNRASPEAIWRFQASYYLDLMDNVEQLARSGNSVAIFGALHLIHLD
jgi:hypothetical protein